MFDIAEIVVRAGHGGNGIVSFLREKGIPKGGPNGGNGGRGADVVFVGRNAMRALTAFQHTKVYEAESGKNGRGKDQYGKGGETMEVEIPCGTAIYRFGAEGADPVRAGELMTEGERLRVARGGRGGRGNAMFASSTQQAPYIAEKGEKGEEWRIRLELKLIADVGIIGKPNAGKSMLLSAASAARPKIAPYPFTTLEPQLGVVAAGWRNFVLAEIPGLLEGAHLGIGLGHEFLRHATRTRLLIHLVDASVEDVAREISDVNSELQAYGDGLDEKPQIIVLNKMDIPEAAARREALAEGLEVDAQRVFFISAAGGVGIKEVMAEAARMLDALPESEPSEEAVPVLAAAAVRGGARIESAGGGIYVVHDVRAVQLVGGSNLRAWAGRAQLKGRLNRMGISEILEKAGIQPGDTVRFGEIDLEW